LDRKQRKEGQKELEDKVNGLMEKRFNILLINSTLVFLIE